MRNDNKYKNLAKKDFEAKKDFSQSKSPLPELREIG